MVVKWGKGRNHEVNVRKDGLVQWTVKGRFRTRDWPKLRTVRKHGHCASLMHSTGSSSWWLTTSGSSAATTSPPLTMALDEGTENTQNHFGKQSTSGRTFTCAYRKYCASTRFYVRATKFSKTWSLPRTHELEMEARRANECSVKQVRGVMRERIWRICNG